MKVNWMKVLGVSCIAAVLIVAALPIDVAAVTRGQPNVIQALKAQVPKVRTKVLKLSVRAYNIARERGQVRRPVLTVVDFSIASNKPRMWTFDMRSLKLIATQKVTHGEGSGGLKVTSLSNAVGSHKSSIGVYQTDSTYYGKNGYSLRLNGLERGFNNNVRKRYIVVHGANYVNNIRGKRIGRSYGCLALGLDRSRKTIDIMKHGSIIVAYYPSAKWLSGSSYLKGGTA